MERDVRVIADLRGQVKISAAPPDKKSFIPILSPKVGQKIMAVAISNEILGIDTHYIDNRTRPCVCMENRCEGCLKKLPLRWKAYLGVQDIASGKLGILELTVGAWLDCSELRSKQGKLRGRELLLQRIGKSRTGKVQLMVGRVREDLQLQKEFDVFGALATVWGI